MWVKHFRESSTMTHLIVVLQQGNKMVHRLGPLKRLNVSPHFKTTKPYLKEITSSGLLLWRHIHHFLPETPGSLCWEISWVNDLVQAHWLNSYTSICYTCDTFLANFSSVINYLLWSEVIVFGSRRTDAHTRRLAALSKEPPLRQHTVAGPWQKRNNTIKR